MITLLLTDWVHFFIEKLKTTIYGKKSHEMGNIEVMSHAVKIDPERREIWKHCHKISRLDKLTFAC